MAKVTGFTAQRMLEIEQASVVDAAIEGEDELIFYTRGGKRIRAGVIKGGTAEWIEEYKPIVDNSAEKVGDLLQSYNDMSELFVEVDQNLANLDQDLEDMHTRVETVSKDAMDALQNANAAAQTVTVEYAISQSHTVPPLSGWANEQPAPQPGDVVWSRIVTTYGSGYTARSEPSPMTGWAGIDGVPGKDGFGVVDTVVSYVTSLSGTVTPSTGWTAAVPTLVQGRFLWTRTVWHYSDSSTETGYSVSYIAQDGSTGDDGLPGKDGVGIINTTITYASSDSGVNAPSSGWIAQPPAAIAGKFVWTRTVWEYSDNTTETGYSVGKIGNTGAKGDSGADGLPGKDGTTLVSTLIQYALTTSGTNIPSTGWDTAIPTLTKGRYLWTKTTWTYSDKTPEVAHTVSYIAQDGSTGDDGLPGKDGVGHTGTTIEYAQSTSGTTAPTSGWAAQPPAPIAGRYIWTRTTWLYSDNTSEFGYSVGKIGDTGAKGDKGDTGTDGLPGKDGFGVKTTAINYAKSTSGTATPSSGWQTTVPAATPGQYLWTRTIWTYTNNTTETGYSVAMWGATGSTGASGKDGIAGKDGVGIKTTVINYVKSTSGTVAPTTGWGTTVPAATAGQYLWTRTVWTYTDNTTETGYSVAMWGTTGAKGDTGAKGNTGTGISSITPQYKSLPNLWGMPNPSENIAGYGGSNSIRTRTPLGLLVEVTNVPTASYSVVYTQSAYRVPVIANKKYTWRLPFKNVGSVPFPLTILSWITGGATRSFRQTLAPGESVTVAIDDMITPQTEDATLRYSIYYDVSETMPPVGSKILVADGATLVEGLTDDPWSNTEPPLQIGYSLFRREKIELDNGTVMYTPTSLVTANQSAERSLYISNLAKELAEGLVDLSPSMPENPLPGQVWISQDEETNMTGVWRFNGSEWQQSSILTGLIMVPGEDGQMTLIGPKGVDAPSVLADIIRTEVLYADVGGVKKFIVSDIPRENLEDGVKTALDTAESIGTRIVLDGSEGKLIIARDKYRSGVSDTMTVLTASSMNFMFDGQAVTSINSATRQLTTVNAQVQGALRFPSHTIKTLPGTSILVFQQA